MFGLLFVLLLLISSSATIDSKCIGTFKELEKEIISNDENLHSLLKAFFPANEYPGIMMKIHYYINSTDDDGNGTIPVHPLALLLSNSNISYSPDYIFYWSSSAVFIYFDYRLVQGLSFYLLRFEPHFAYIVIPEFCSNITNNTIMELINDATIWMKSYAVNGQFSFEGVIEHHLQGYSQNKSSDHGETISIISLVISLPLMYFLFSSYMLGIYLFVKYCKEVSKMCQQNKQKHQRFRFKSIFWAAILTIFLINLLVLLLWLIHSLNLDLLGLYSGIISAMLCLAIVINSVVVCVAAVAKICCNNKCCSCNKISLEEVWAFWTVATTAITLPVLLFGLMLRIFISPEQVFVAILLVLTGSLTFGIFITFCIDKYIDAKDFERDNTRLQNQLNFNKIDFILLIYCGFYFVFSIIAFSYVCFQVILFSGVDNIKIVDGAGQLFMALLLGLLLWRMKKEYKDGETNNTETNSEVNDEEENDEINDVMTIEVPNTHPRRGMANPTNDVTNEETPLVHTRP